MASKQLGKLRQWAGEVIAVRDKTILSDEFRDLEHDVELRRRGLWRLHVASEDYHHALSKKKISEAVDSDEKLLPIDALGVVMIQHGEEFGEDSAFGTSLVSLGKAHCQIATLQEAFAVLFNETYLASIQRAEDDIKEYQSQRKKLDSRRLTYDAAVSKLEKSRANKKEKEKDRQDAEDEYEMAKSRYEECAEDVRARMYAIQENELEQLRDLTGMLDTEVHFVEQYLDVLKQVKAGWVDDATLAQMEGAKRSRPPPRPLTESRAGSIRSRKSASKRSVAGSDESVSEDEVIKKSQLKKSSSMRKADSGTTSRPPSRPQSRAERKRTESITSLGTDKEDKKEKAEKSKRMSVAGWMGSLTGRGKKAKGDALIDDDDDNSDSSDDDRTKPSRSRRPSATSRSSPTKGRPSSSVSASPVIPPRPLRLPTQTKKLALALHDFNASSTDELSFRSGDQITVINEVLDGWWMGELQGRTGLFPTTYVEVISSSSSSSLLPRPSLPPRPSASAPVSAHPSPLPPPARTPKWLTSQETGNSLASMEDPQHPFGDHLIAASRSPLDGTFRYAESIASSGASDDEGEGTRLVPAREASDDGRYDYRVAPAPPVPVRRPSIPASAKRAPPPPPPRRGSMGVNMLQPPPIPGRLGSNPSSRTNSTNASFVSIAQDEGLTASPFD